MREEKAGDWLMERDMYETRLSKLVDKVVETNPKPAEVKIRWDACEGHTTCGYM